MRPFVIFAILFCLSFALVSNAQAAGKSSCKVETADIGTTIGNGPSSEAAFEDAATQCFERRRQLFLPNAPLFSQFFQPVFHSTSVMVSLHH